jgi:hypothetical protein
VNKPKNKEENIEFEGFFSICILQIEKYPTTPSRGGPVTPLITFASFFLKKNKNLT